MDKISRDFVSRETRSFRFRIGKMLASSLAGFVVGVIVASIAWFVGVWYFQQVQNIPPSPTYTTSQPSV